MNIFTQIEWKTDMKSFAIWYDSDWNKKTTTITKKFSGLLNTFKIVVGLFQILCYPSN